MSDAAYDLFGNPIFIHVNCASCTVPFGVHKPVHQRRRNDGQTFYCPNGHTNVYRETRADQLEKELAKEKQRRVWAEESRDIAQREAKTQEHRARAYKGKFTHVKTRVGNGVCPCCNRTFQNLMRHMKTKHKNWKTK